MAILDAGDVSPHPALRIPKCLLTSRTEATALTASETSTARANAHSGHRATTANSVPPPHSTLVPMLSTDSSFTVPLACSSAAKLWFMVKKKAAPPKTCTSNQVSGGRLVTTRNTCISANRATAPSTRTSVTPAKNSFA